MPSQLYRMGVRLTENQQKIIEQFAKSEKLERPQDILQAIFKAHFPDWPDEYPGWGKHSKRKPKQEAGK